MNRLALAMLLSIFAMASFAQSPAHAPAAAPATEPAAATNAGEVTEISGDQDRLETPNCLHQTGTRIVNKDKQTCANAAGRSFSNKDIRRTGAHDVGDALELLDPALQIHR